MLGWNIRVGRGYYNKNSNGALFIGGGALTDYGSRMYSHGGFVINKELKNTYPFWEIGIVFSLNHIFFIEGTYRFMFDGKPSEDFVSTASLNLGAGIFLPLW